MPSDAPVAATRCEAAPLMEVEKEETGCQRTHVIIGFTPWNGRSRQRYVGGSVTTGAAEPSLERCAGLECGSGVVAVGV